jgi:hypothetical protein
MTKFRYVDFIMPGGCKATAHWAVGGVDGTIEVPWDHRGCDDRRTQDTLRHSATLASGQDIEWFITRGDEPHSTRG